MATYPPPKRITTFNLIDYIADDSDLTISEADSLYIKRKGDNVYGQMVWNGLHSHLNTITIKNDSLNILNSSNEIIAYINKNGNILCNDLNGISNAQLSYLTNITSNVQTQIELNNTNIISNLLLINNNYTTLDNKLNTKATESYVNTQINNLIANAPATLDTLQEISVSLNNDPDFYNSINTLIQGKADMSLVTTNTSSITTINTTLTSLQSQITSNDTDIDALQTVTTGISYTSDKTLINNDLQINPQHHVTTGFHIGNEFKPKIWAETQGNIEIYNNRIWPSTFTIENGCTVTRYRNVEIWNPSVVYNGNGAFTGAQHNLYIDMPVEGVDSRAIRALGDCEFDNIICDTINNTVSSTEIGYLIGASSNIQSQLDSNTSNISTNTSDISNNNSNVSINTSNISTNTSDISANTSNISTNTSNISANTSNLSTKAPLNDATFTNTTTISTLHSGPLYIQPFPSQNIALTSRANTNINADILIGSFTLYADNINQTPTITLSRSLKNLSPFDYNRIETSVVFKIKQGATLKYTSVNYAYGSSFLITSGQEITRNSISSVETTFLTSSVAGTQYDVYGNASYDVDVVAHEDDDYLQYWNLTTPTSAISFAHNRPTNTRTGYVSGGLISTTELYSQRIRCLPIVLDNAISQDIMDTDTNTSNIFTVVGGGADAVYKIKSNQYSAGMTFELRKTTSSNPVFLDYDTGVSIYNKGSLSARTSSLKLTGSDKYIRFICCSTDNWYVTELH